MDPSLLGGIIGAVATLSSPFVSWILARYWSTRRFLRQSEKNRRGLSGVWTGTETQEEGPELPDTNFS